MQVPAKESTSGLIEAFDLLKAFVGVSLELEGKSKEEMNSSELQCQKNLAFL